ncbi:VOC family protein, partial [Bacillus cereus]
MLKGIYVTYTNYYKALKTEKEENYMKNWVQ